MKIRIVLLAVLILAVGLGAGLVSAEGKTITVGPSGCDYSSIQEAIEAARPGDTIVVKAGTYRENLTITTGLILQGAGKDQTTLIGTVSIATADEVAFKGFTLTGGRGLTIRDSSAITISDNTISESRGAGLLLSNAAASIENNLITGNANQGVLIAFNSDVALRANTITDNGKDGVEVDASRAVLEANVIKGNGGCGVKADSDSTVEGKDNAIVRNGENLCGVSSTILERVPPPAPINLSVKPEGWTNRPTVDWENPEDPSEIRAFWYKIGSEPTSSRDGKRLDLDEKPLIVRDSPEGEQPIYVWLEDGTGNKSHENCAQGSFLFDKTPPEIWYTVNPEPNEHGWWNSGDVTVTFECGEDQLSGLASCTPSAPVVISEEGRHQVVGVALDNAGNRGKATVTISIDMTAPTIQVGRPQGEEGQESWYRSDVTVPYTARDNLSGFANGDLTIEGSERTLSEGVDRTVVIRVSDLASNMAEATAGPFKVDKTPPVITSLKVNGGTGLACPTSVRLDLQAADDLSGIWEMAFSNDGQTWSSWEPYKETTELPAFGAVVWARVTDKAGNVSAAAGIPCFSLALIPAGSFQMGDSFNESDSDERPVHTVYVSAFYMDRYEVTKALWDEVAGWAAAHGYDIEPEDGGTYTDGTGKAEDHPVVYVSWYEAVKWANARSEREGLTPVYTVGGNVYRTGRSTPDCNWSANGYRLPTEAEWEYAARGALEGQRYPWGNDIDSTKANYNDNVDHTTPVGSYPPNGYGLYDMAGNVWEYVWDWYDWGYYSSSPGSDPCGPASGSLCVLRGGGWCSRACRCRVAGRYCFGSPGYEHNDLGFRLVRTAP